MKIAKNEIDVDALLWASMLAGIPRLSHVHSYGKVRSSPPIIRTPREPIYKEPEEVKPELAPKYMHRSARIKKMETHNWNDKQGRWEPKNDKEK